MTHPRTLIRAAFVERLINATAAEERVHKGRLMPINDEDEEDQGPTLPAIVVHTRAQEQIISRSSSGWSGYERRRCVVSVVCVAQSDGDVEELLDTMAQQVEDTIQPWTIPGFESAEIEPHTTTTAEPEFDGSLTTGATTLAFPVAYLTPYRDCSNPYVTGDDEPLEHSGAYPGGRVTAGCPVGNTGEACPIADAELFADGEPIT